MGWPALRPFRPARGVDVANLYGWASDLVKHPDFSQEARESALARFLMFYRANPLAEAGGDQSDGDARKVIAPKESFNEADSPSRARVAARGLIGPGGFHLRDRYRHRQQRTRRPVHGGWCGRVHRHVDGEWVAGTAKRRHHHRQVHLLGGRSVERDSGGVLGHTYEYAFSFNWAGAATTTTFDFRWLSDDYLTDIKLNEASLGVNNIGQPSPWTTSYSASVQGNVVSGLNTVKFFIANTGGQAPGYQGVSGPTGLAADFTVHGDATSVPDGGLTLALLGFGLTSLGVLRRRIG